MGITTFDYIPKIILGKTGNYLFNSINLFTRAIAFYIYFKTSDELDILEIILAYVFPIIYILYKISQENTDYIAGLFSFKKTSGERCIERRGADLMADKHGTKKSIPEDAAACGNVVLDTINTGNECQAVASVGDPDDPDMFPTGINACLYIPKEDDGGPSYKTYECNIHQSETRCDSQKDYDNNRLCNWHNISASGVCSNDLYRVGKFGGDSWTLGENECPRSCQYTPPVTGLVPDAVADGTTLTFPSVDNSGQTSIGVNDVLTFSNRDSETDCAVDPNTVTVTSVSRAGETFEVTTMTGDPDAADNCLVSRAAGRCTSDDSGDDGSNGGSLRGMCLNN